jgi:hypothetical protein
MSDWIRVHAQLVSRPVVARCAEALRIDTFKAIGHLVTFWGAAAEHSQRGHITTVPDVLLERWAGWTGKRGAFAAWVRAEHTDDQGRIREWEEYQGALDVRRERDRERKRREREGVTSGGRPPDSPRDVRVTSGATERNGTERDKTPPADTSREVGESLTMAQRLVIATNHAVTARWGEQTRPMLPGHGPTVQLVSDLTQAGVPVEFACASIVRQVEAKGDGPPRSMGYFRPGILDDWQAEQVRALGEGVTPVAPLAGRSRNGETGFLAAVIRGEA